MTSRDAAAEGAAATFEPLLLANLGLLDSVVGHLGRRHRLDASEREELAAMVRLKLVDRDYDVLRQFEGRSSLRTYLTVVATRVLLDARARRWGKWRPSVVARRLGETAVHLEALLFRDRRPLAEAVDLLRRSGVVEPEDALAALARKLPPRVAPREVEEETADGVAAPVLAEQAVLDREAAEVAQRAERAIAQALEGLPVEDAAILRMHFVEGCPLSNVARALALPQKPLYRRVERMLAALRHRLEEEGVSREGIRDLLDEGRLAPRLEIARLFPARNAAAGPSL